MNFNVKHTLSYHKGHPNPQKYRSNYVLLNGKWNFAFDHNNCGLDNRYFEKFPADCLQIEVPYPYQCEASGISMPNEQCDVIWYQREFDVADVTKKHIINFGSVDYICDVYVNGVFAMHHEGGYDAFSCNVTPFVNAGKNKLTLRIVDEMEIDQVRGKQRWRKDSFTCFYTETSGIVRDVYMEVLNHSHIDSFFAKGDYLSKLLTLDVGVVDAIGKQLRVELTNADGKSICVAEANVCQSATKIEMRLENVVGWCHENPYLYNLKLSLCDGQTLLDEVLSYVGFVSIATKDRHFYINGQDTYLKFVLNQGYWADTLTTPTEEQIVGDVLLTLQCGFNGARMHEHTPSPLNFYYMDLHGLYAWQECPSAHGYSYKAQKGYYKQFPRIISDHFNHPCIMAYVLFNESWGVNEIHESEEIRQMTADMYHLCKDKANDRLVISNDGWEHTLSDVITFHNYAEEYQYLKDFFEPNIRGMYDGNNTECISNFKKFFAGDYRYNGQPVMFSEFAGIAFARDDGTGWGYGKSVGTEKDFLAKYQGQLQFILEREDIRGFCMTQLTDVFQEKNGLFAMDRKEKVTISAIKAMHDKFN